MEIMERYMLKERMNSKSCWKNTMNGSKKFEELKKVMRNLMEK